MKYKIAYASKEIIPKEICLYCHSKMFNDLFEHNLYEKLKLLSLENKVGFIDFSIENKIDKKNLRHLCKGIMLSIPHDNWWLFKIKNKRWAKIEQGFLGRSSTNF